MLRYLPYLLVLALWIYTFIDCLTTPEEQVRNLPKVVWVIIILLFGEVLIGPIAWMVAGKPRAGAIDHRQGRGIRQQHSEPMRYIPPDDNPEFLAALKKDNEKHEDMLKEWEADLHRREEEMRRRTGDSGSGPEDERRRD